MMSFKEWTAAGQLIGEVIIVGWLVWDALGGRAAGLGITDVAVRLCWAIVAMIGLNILLTILAVIVGSIVAGEELKDEKADERDMSIDARSGRNAGYVTSGAAGLSLLALALGADPIFAVYALFAAPALGGATDSVSRLIYYRVG
jgi:hypothetical protein